VVLPRGCTGGVAGLQPRTGCCPTAWCSLLRSP
jgi:hypothetical protein